MRKALTGERLVIPAADWNQLIDSANRSAHQHQPRQARQSLGAYLSVSVRNDSGSDVDQFGVLKIGDPIITPTVNLQGWKNDPTFIGTTPSTTNPRTQFVVMQEPVKADRIGEGLLVGLTQVQVDVVNALHTRADVKNSTLTMLQSNSYGRAEILWKESGTGTKWATVRMGEGFQRCLGKTDASHAKGASGTVSLYSGTPGSETDTTENLTGVWNKFAAIGSGKWVWVDWQDGMPYETAAEC